MKEFMNLTPDQYGKFRSQQGGGLVTCPPSAYSALPWVDSNVFVMVLKFVFSVNVSFCVV